jgi:maleylacetoacetate isomerase
MDSKEPKPEYHFYTFYRSSCAARVIIAALLKDIPLIQHEVDMRKDEHETADFRKINPSASIPILVVKASGKEDFVLAQSTAILEYLEETHRHQTRLLPPETEPEKRARVREMQSIITTDIFPPTNSRIATRVQEINGSRDDQIKFVHQIMKEGFSAYEEMVQRFGGKYSIGNEVTLADVCLVPALAQAMGSYRLDMSPFKRIMEVYHNLMELDAFKKTDWRTQGNTSAEQRTAA